MICGSCKQQGVTVAHVKHCYSLGQAPEPMPEPEPTHTPVGEGLYMTTYHGGAEHAVKVQRAVHGSGRLYAKWLVDDTGKFEMAPGMYYKLHGGNTRPMTKEEASHFGHLYGMCMLCGRTLTDEASIEMGIGPICAGKQGWI